jgi:sec-independent protein translocase protein TatC
MARKRRRKEVAPAGASPEIPEDDVEMGFFDHLRELRTRLIRALWGMIPGVAAGWIFREELLALLVRPFQIAWIANNREGDAKLVFLNPIDPFVAYLKIAMITGLMIGAPWVFWQLWGFISPGLYRKEKRLALPFVIVSTLFFIGGITFGYLAVFPFAFQYFLEFAVTLPGGMILEPTIAINEILTFEVRMLLAFGIVFELPVVVTFLAAAGVVTWRQLLKFSRWWILIAAVLSAILTPPDPGSMMLMFIPLVLLWFLSVLFAALIGRKKKKDPAPADPE